MWHLLVFGFGLIDLVDFGISCSIWDFIVFSQIMNLVVVINNKKIIIVNVVSFCYIGTWQNTIFVH